MRVSLVVSSGGGAAVLAVRMLCARAVVGQKQTEARAKVKAKAAAKRAGKKF